MITSYYTKTISEEVTKALHEVNFPFPIADMGFAVPQIVEMPVDYASVLDWLSNQEIQFGIIYIPARKQWYCCAIDNEKRKFPDKYLDSLTEAFDKIILLAIEFLKSKKDGNA